MRYVIEWEDFDGSGYCLKYCSRKKIDNRKCFSSKEGELSQIMVFNSKEKAVRVKKRIEKRFCIILKIKKISNDTAKRMNEELYFKYILYSCKKIENELTLTNGQL